jgi:DNA-binding Lrp family transcriptional regulator
VIDFNSISRFNYTAGADGRDQQADKVSLADFGRFNSIQSECDKVFYTPKSKFHVDFLWLSQWFKHLNCPRQAILLLQVLYFSHKDGSVFVNGTGESYQGMLVNFRALEDRLGFSRKVCLTSFKKLEEQGLIVRITLKNNRILYQATNKANNLLNDLHTHSLAANTDKSDYDKVSQNFDNISVSAPSYAQRDRQAFTFGNSSIYKVNIKKVNKKNNNQYNLSQELESVGATENLDCDGIVIFSDFCDFDFSEFGLGAVKCESRLFDYLTVSQAKAINTITHVNAAKIDIVAFNSALDRKDIKREAQDFKQFVSWCYLVAVDAKGASVAKGSMIVNDYDFAESVAVSDSINLGKVDAVGDNGNKNNRQTKLNLDVVINELKAILADQSLEVITAKVLHLNNQYDIDTENELVAAVLCDFGLISEDDFLGGFGAASESEVIQGRDSLTTKDDNNLKAITVKDDNANNEMVDQVNHNHNSEIVVDGVGISKGESVGLSDVEAVNFNGDFQGQARDSRETVANDNNYQQNVSADNTVKDNEIVIDQFLNLGESKYKDFVKLCLKRGFSSETQVIESATRAIKTYGNLNFDQLYNGIIYSHFTVPKLIDRQEVSKTEHENTKAQVNNKAKNPLSTNPSLKLPTLADLKMPVVEKELLYKDWAILAKQSLGLATVTECQKVALVAIIDYVKRKGVVITSDQEVYEWLYHTVSNYEYYFSGATSFKHLANILIKRLVNQSFNRPSGFDNWRKMVGGNVAVTSVNSDKKTINNDLKNYSTEMNLLLGRIEGKINITNDKKEVKKCHQKLYYTRHDNSFLV